MSELKDRAEIILEILKCEGYALMSYDKEDLSSLIKDQQARIEELEKGSSELYLTSNAVIQEQKAREKALVEALTKCLIGGNHLAHILIKNLGPGFVDKYQPNSDHAFVLTELGVGDNYDVWCCWNAMMQAREMQEALQTKPKDGEAQ